MKRQQIYDAFDNIRPDQAAKERMLQNILSEASGSQPAGKDVSMRKYNRRRPLLVAAMVAVMLLLVGCAAVVAMNLKDLQIGEYSYTEPNHFDENGEKVYASEKTRDVISLQGIAGSKNQKAAQEWYEFEQSYDPDNAILFASDDFKAPSEYDAYFVYSQEMIDKVDEISTKYDLKLAGPIALTQIYQQDIFFDALGLNGLTKPDAEVQLEDGSGYFYECGNFKLEFWLTLTREDIQWKNHETLVSYSYKNKDHFDTVYCTVEDIDAVTQWNYTLADGTEILIVNSGEAARIFCDREDAFISVGFDTTYIHDNGTKETMSKQDIELIAESLDFTVKPQKPDMAEAQKKIAETDAEYLAQQEAMMETWVDPWIQDSYADYIQYLLDGSDNPANCTYAIEDVNGDGVEDLLIGYLDMAKDMGGDEDCFIEVFTMQDGKSRPLFLTTSPLYLCEGYVLECNEDNEYRLEHSYHTLGSDYDTSTMELEKFECVVYDKFEEVWKYDDVTNMGDTVISEEEAREIMDSYARIPVDMKPITEFPMN